MERIFTYSISKEEADQKISSFLKGRHFSNQNLVDLKKDPKGVAVNGCYVRQNTKLAEGDRLEIFWREMKGSDGILPVKLEFEILYEDEDILVINKPAGMPIHPSRNNPDNSLANGLAYYYKEKGIPFTFRCINRLDRDTSGLTIVAKHGVSAAILSQMVAEKTYLSKNQSQLSLNSLKESYPPIKRRYLALVESHPVPEKGSVEAAIARQEELDVERVIDEQKGDYALTHYELLAQYSLTPQNGDQGIDGQEKEISLLSLILETGRTHQIRVHMKHIGCPLLGDYLYNPTNEDMKRQALHAASLEFTHPVTWEKMSFQAKLPEDMAELLAGAWKRSKD